MDTKDWYSFHEASLKEGKNKNWLHQHYKRNPDYFDKNSIKKIGKMYVINDEGIDYFKKHLKKEGDHVIVRAST